MKKSGARKKLNKVQIRAAIGRAYQAGYREDLCQRQKFLNALKTMNQNLWQELISLDQDEPILDEAVRIPIVFTEGLEKAVKEGHSLKGGLTLGTYTHPSPDRLREIVEQLANYDFPRQAILQKATGTDGKPVDKILLKSYSDNGQQCNYRTNENEQNVDSEKITQFFSNNEGANHTHNPLVVGSNPTGPIQQNPTSQRLTKSKPTNELHNRESQQASST